jgi:hypothetical protein
MERMEVSRWVWLQDIGKILTKLQEVFMTRRMMTRKM